MADRQKLPALARTFVSAMLAGIMIGIGGMAFLSCPDRTVGALLFCVLIGVIFGSYPASKASRMTPIDALQRR